jgi:hypothetical protein
MRFVARIQSDTDLTFSEHTDGRNLGEYVGRATEAVCALHFWRLRLAENPAKLLLVKCGATVNGMIPPVRPKPRIGALSSNCFYRAA